MKSGSTVYGYARNVKCYIAEISNNVYVQGEEQSEYKSEFGGIYYNEITGCFNNSNNSFTPAVPSANNLKVTEIVSKDIASKIQKNCRIKIAKKINIAFFILQFKELYLKYLLPDLYMIYCILPFFKINVITTKQNKLLFRNKYSI